MDSLYVSFPSPDQLRNIEHLTGLRELILHQPTTDEILASARLGNLTGLRGFQVWYCADVTDGAVKPLLESFTRLAYLYLAGSGVGDATLQTAAKLEDLTVLDLKRTAVTDDGMRALSTVSHLEEIELAETVIGDAGVRDLVSSRGVLKLDLSKTRVTDVGIRELASCTSLRQLSLSDTQVTDEGLRFLDRTQSLEYLNLNGTDITGPILATIGRLPNLRSLRMWETAVGDDALRHLHGMTQLRNLTLSDEAVTPSALLDLLESLPNLAQVWVGLTPFCSTESIEQLKGRLRKAPSSARSLRKEERRPTTSGASSWPGEWRSRELPAHAGRADIGSIASTSDGVMWVASFGYPTAGFDAEPSWRQPGWSPQTEGLCVLEGTTKLAIGPDDSVTVATGRALWRYVGQRWHQLIGPELRFIGGVATGGHGTVHAFRGETLYSMGNGAALRERQIEFERSSATCIAVDHSGGVWIGSWNGVSRLEEGTWRAWKGSADGLPVVREPGTDDFAWERRDWTPVESIAVDSAGVVWIAGEGGVARFIEDDWQFVPGSSDLPRVFRAITFDGDGNVFVTGDRYVAAHVGGRWRVAEAPDHLLPENGWLQAIHVRRDGIWVGAGTGQLLQFRPAEWD